ncbi:RsbRD N-terminal domain-containing protein [Spirosoma validum]|uniref:RsbRD N-terminal domain-containing protein n=1 Tax=Spirosoma validum TaxID=2771355 RepID=A0A927GHK0_9BACT|nr:RsbRD N-terminal domain-containing protein [Spirosoma validum]MBD2757735.1 RsbRD N-terminal domain-containing protein [Spirosoma validum]
MIAPALSESAPGGQLASFLAARRPALLANWRTACETDPDLRSVNRLSRDEFTNQVPFMLNVLQQQLQQQDEEAQVDRLAADHGLLRWHKGYVLAELLAEMHYLNQSMLAELGGLLATLLRNRLSHDHSGLCALLCVCRSDQHR